MRGVATWLPPLAGALAVAASAGPATGQPRPVAPRAAARPATADMRGVVLGVYSDADGDRYRTDLEEIAGLGASHVLVVVQQAVEDVRSTRIRPRPWLTPSAERLDAVLEHAGDVGLGIVLMPSLYVEDTGEGQWRGALAPEGWPRWWRSYESFILEHARTAAAHGVELFSVGSELCSTERQRGRWEDLIRRVRDVTPSQLTYSFNWDHLEPGRIADLVDVAGLNAYHDLSDRPGTPVDGLVDRWRTIQGEIAAWQSRHGRPILFTEVGYRSVDTAEIAPWNYLAERPADAGAQARCYEAFLRAWDDRPGLLGAFFYSWRGTGGPDDTGYTPRGKPAEQVLRRWFSEMRRHDDETSTGQEGGRTGESSP